MYTRKHADRLYMAGFVLLSSMLACRPVLAIGWGEFLILVVVVVVLIGPPIYRLMQRMNTRRKDK